MNKIPAKVTDIQTCDILNITSFNFANFNLSMMSLELLNLKVNSKVILTAKPSSVAIGKDFNGEISYSNQLKGKIQSIENGELLTYIKVLVDEIIIQSIITKKSSQRMDLKKDDEAICIIKASDLSILEILND